MKKNYLDSLREALNKQLEKSTTEKSFSNELELVPEAGKTYKVRLIPGEYKFGVEKDLDLFYWMDSFHYMEGVTKNNNGPYVYTRPDYTVDGKTVMCPIDKAVKDMYDSKEQQLISIAQKIKRKRQYKFNAILYEIDNEALPKPKYVILKDTSSEGLLAKFICDKLGIPFVRDAIQTKPWIDKFEPAKGKKTYDLLSETEGYDLVIARTRGKKIAIPGKDSVYGTDYSSSFVWEEPRDLTDEDKAIVADAKDLTSLVDYVPDFETAENILKEYLDIISGKPTEEVEEKPAKAIAKPVPKVAAKPAVEEDDDDLEDDIISALRNSATSAKEEA